MESRASDKRRVHVLIRTALLIASAYFIGLAKADAARASTFPHSEFIEHIKQERIGAVRTKVIVGRAREAPADEPRRVDSGDGERG